MCKFANIGEFVAVNNMVGVVKQIDTYRNFGVPHVENSEIAQGFAPTLGQI